MPRTDCAYCTLEATTEGYIRDPSSSDALCERCAEARKDNYDGFHALNRTADGQPESPRQTAAIAAFADKQKRPKAPADFHDRLADMSIQVRRLVICVVCKMEHDPEKETFHTIAGDIYVGFSGGLVGCNFQEDGTLYRTTTVCRARDCVLSLFDMKGW